MDVYIDKCMDMCVGMRTDMYIGIYGDMCVGMWHVFVVSARHARLPGAGATDCCLSTDNLVDMCVNTCMDMCASVAEEGPFHDWQAPSIHRQRHFGSSINTPLTMLLLRTMPPPPPPPPPPLCGARARVCVCAPPPFMLVAYTLRLCFV